METRTIQLPNNEYTAEISGLTHVWKNIHKFKYRLLKNGKRVNGNRKTLIVMEINKDGSIYAGDHEGSEKHTIAKAFINSLSIGSLNIPLLARLASERVELGR